MDKVTILGCGWVGAELKAALIPNYEVGCILKDMEEKDTVFHYKCNVLVIAIPPRDNYLEILTHTLSKIDAFTQVILLSSISFYDGKPLVVQAESLVQHHHKKTVILRLGGLMGYDRIAGKYTAGKVLTSDSRTNYVHRDDVVGIIQSVIDQNIASEVFDVVAPLQYSKKEIFSQNAKRFGFEKTEFLSGDMQGKIIKPKKVFELLGYEFLKKDVRYFWDFCGE